FFARMTSRYGDVYLLALAVSSSRSILLHSMEYGLGRGIGTSRSGVCQTKRKSTLNIRHYIYEHEYLASSKRPWAVPARAAMLSICTSAFITPEAISRSIAISAAPEN